MKALNVLLLYTIDFSQDKKLGKQLYKIMNKVLKVIFKLFSEVNSKSMKKENINLSKLY